jgi:pyridoxine kinase
MRRLCEVADYILPNLTEAAFVLGQKPVLEGYDQAFIEKMVRDLHGIGAKNVILTGVSFAPDKLGVATFDGTNVRYYFNTRLEKLSHGTGDVYASVFAGALMRGFGMHEAASLAADIVCESIKATPDDHWYGVCFERAIPELVRRIAAGA